MSSINPGPDDVRADDERPAACDPQVNERGADDGSGITDARGVAADPQVNDLTADDYEI